MHGHAAILLLLWCYCCFSTSIDARPFYYYWDTAILLGLGLLLIDATDIFLLLFMCGYTSTLLKNKCSWFTAMQIHCYSCAAIDTQTQYYAFAAMMMLLYFYYYQCVAFLLLLACFYTSRVRVTIDRYYWSISTTIDVQLCCCTITEELLLIHGHIAALLLLQRHW